MMGSINWGLFFFAILWFWCISFWSTCLIFYLFLLFIAHLVKFDHDIYKLKLYYIKIIIIKNGGYRRSQQVQSNQDGCHRWWCRWQNLPHQMVWIILSSSLATSMTSSQRSTCQQSWTATAQRWTLTIELWHSRSGTQQVKTTTADSDHLVTQTQTCSCFATPSMTVTPSRTLSRSGWLSCERVPLPCPSSS